MIEVLSTGGDANLGGDDWDAAIMQWLVDEHLKPARVDCTVREGEMVQGWMAYRFLLHANQLPYFFFSLLLPLPVGPTPRGQPARCGRGSQNQAQQ